MYISSVSLAGLVSHTNSTFTGTAEVLVIYLALSSFRVTHTNIVVLSDSLCGQNPRNLDLKSPTSSSLLSTIQRLSNLNHEIQIILFPEYKVITPNEKADALAKNDHFSCSLPGSLWKMFAHWLKRPGLKNRI